MRIILILTLISTQTFGQLIASEQIDESKVQRWLPRFTVEYHGVYHFGDSESESDLILIFSNDKVFGQIRSGKWSADGKSWIWSYENLQDIKIEGNKFTSNKTEGEFVIYFNGFENKKGLKVMSPWSEIAEEGQWELGLKAESVAGFLKGRFTQASLRLLDATELTKMTKSDLKLMRNEIFARYGLKFKKGGEIDNYFRKQAWYVGQHNNVDEFLTDLEKENLHAIQESERK